MRVSTAFNRLLQVPGASVVAVLRAGGGGGRAAPARPAARLPALRLPGQGGLRPPRAPPLAHLDLGSTRCFLECELRRFRCPGCERVVTEAVAWARPGARFSRDFEDVVAWLAQQAAFSVISRLLRVTWRSVAAIVRRVVADELGRRRLGDLYLIGVDEVSYRRGQRYLTLVADHADGAVVWAGTGRGAATLERFFDELGKQETEKVRAVSIDMAGGYQKALRSRCAQASVCFDPFHVVALANRALDQLRRALWNRLGKSKGSGRVIKGTRWALLKDPAALSDSQQGTLAFLVRLNSPLYRGYYSDLRIMPTPLALSSRQEAGSRFGGPSLGGRVPIWDLRHGGGLVNARRMRPRCQVASGLPLARLSRKLNFRSSIPGAQE